MRFIFISILLVFAQFALAQKNVLKSPAPEWVNDISFNEENILEDNGGYQYLLIDYQDNFIKKASFRHFVIKLINSNGIQSNSDISVVFDPSYQKLTFHKISIIRDGQPIDKLELQNFQVFQRESSLERALYDGSLTAVLNLTDVRENDIIEYSYTLTGFNPIYKEIFSNTFYHQYSIPVNRIYNRLIVNNKKEFAYKLFNENIEPQIITNSGNKEYIWNLEAFDFKLYDTNIPSWIDIHKRVSFTSAENWNDIVNWALPLYTFDKRKVEKIAKSITESDSIKQAALDFIRFVQDNIRYLGFEDGINAFKPHQPEKVFAQRYGDCKDKSLLLVALLQSIGIDAHPLLVNTYLKNEILNELPSINSFNHCIACFSIDGRNYVIDPTISYQGGNLDNLSTPNYCYGLMIKKGETGLTQIIPTPKPTIKIDEILSLDSINGNAKFEVSTEYSSAKANSTRDYFNSSSRDVIKKDYTDFYRNLYPRIETATEINLTDKNRKSSNKLFVKENYFVKNIWENSTTPNKIYCEIYPLVLENYINYDQAINRKLPYYLGEPFAFSQTTEVNLPESWNSKNYNFSTENEAFKYSNKIIAYTRYCH